jgi:hypothetical protein
MPRPSREDEVDVGYALEASPVVRGVYALRSPDTAVDHPDAYHFGVVLRPYTGESLASTHFALLQATNHGVTGRVLYAGQVALGAVALPRVIEEGRLIVVEPHERGAARARFLQRTTETTRQWRLEEQAMAQALQAAFENRTFGAPIGASLQSGEFEIVKDPLEKLPPARVLVLDRDEATTRALATLGEVEVVTAPDGWSALEMLVEGDFHLVLCALSFDGWRGSKLYSMVAKARPETAARIVFLAMEADVAAAPPSSALGRVMARPVDPDAVRRMIARVQQGR